MTTTYRERADTTGAAVGASSGAISDCLSEGEDGGVVRLAKRRGREREAERVGLSAGAS
jgi:hypothetical protein